VTAVGIIPARYAATRLPGKPLLDIGGQPMIRRVYERARQAGSLAEVLVATDDERILGAVRAFGGRAVMTAAEHRSGTDRLAEVAAGLEADVIVNIQGDEPLIEPAEIDLLVEPFRERADLQMTTLATPIRLEADFRDPAVVKVVVDRAGYALYFSRQPIPHERQEGRAERLKHVGMYAYRRAFLLAYTALPPTPLEAAECLEQLRVLEHGHRIFVVRSEHDAISVDTEADLLRVREVVEREVASSR
jgi:3-deoxy-manno-octulosonate cytidylyltransferase (CMP-KDO synthetase)